MEHISKPELRDFLEGDLPPDRLMEVDDHLAVCSECRETLEGEARLGYRGSSIQAEFAAPQTHLEYEQLIDAAEGRRVSTELEHHLTICSTCAREVADLRSFVAETAEAPRSFRVTEAVAAQARNVNWRTTLIWSGMAAAILIGVGFYWQTSLRNSQRSPALANLRDGDYNLLLDKSGQLRGAEGLQPDEREALRASLATGRLVVSTPSNFTANQTETMLGGPISAAFFKVISPVNRVVIEDRPTFSWESMPKATGYRVRVYATGYRKVAESDLVRGTQWQETTSLARGERYTWTVTAESPKGEVRAPAPPQPEATFEVLNNGAAKSLKQAMQDRGTDHLLLAILYARAGVTDEARAQLDLLAGQNPGSNVVAELKTSLDQLAPSPIRTNAAQ